MTQTELSYDQLGDMAPIIRPSAADVRAGKRGRIRGLVLRCLQGGQGGATDEEIANYIEGSGVMCRHSTVVSARNWLCENGLVYDSENRRLSPTSLCRCTVWRAR